MYQGEVEMYDDTFECTYCDECDLCTEWDEDTEEEEETE
jgi:hypothetical protein